MADGSRKNRSGSAHEQTDELTQMARQNMALLDISRAVQAIETTKDLEGVVRVMFEQMKTLGLDFAGLTFQRLIDAKTYMFEQHHVRPDGEYRKYSGLRPATYGEWQGQHVLYRRDLSFVEYRKGLPDDFRLPYQELGLTIRCLLHVPNRYGVLTLRSETPHAFSDVEVDAIKNLAEMLELGISRVEDLERLEAQNATLAQANVILKAEINERQKAEEALRQERDRAQQYLDIAGVVLVALDRDGFITMANRCGLDLLGYKEGELVGKNWFETCLPEKHRDNVYSVFRRLMDGETVPAEYFENLVLTKDGQERVVSWHNAILRDADGSAVGTLSSGEDVTEHRKMQLGLIRLERLRALGEMSAGVSHNLNNIMTGVLGPAQLLLIATDDPYVREEAERIIASAKRVRDLVRRLHLSVQGIEEEALEPVQVNQVIQNAVEITRPRWKDEPEAKDIVNKVSTELGDIPLVLCTESRLHDIFVNLILNAVDAMPEGGTIEISSKPVEDGVQISVSDTGIGMSEETQKRVFEPFFTTKMDVGSGLGLYTVYGAVTQWGGDIRVESGPGRKGTTFTIRLPACS